MKKQKILALITIITASLLTSSIVFAEQLNNVSQSTITTNDPQVKEKMDPIQSLEDRKADIQKKLSEGKITKEEASEKLDRINKKIEEIKAFNKLPISEKRIILLNNFTAKLNEQVRNGKMTQVDADKVLKEFKAAIEKWDGTGYPPFPGKSIIKSDGKCGKHKKD